MKNKLISILAAAVAALCVPMAFAAAACSQNENIIKINEVTHSVFYAPLYLADALGYFGDEGYEIELTNGGGADNTMAAVLAGEADIGFCGPEAVIYTYLGGGTDSPKVFGQLTKRDGSFLVGRTADENFEWSHLEGKKILAGRPGGVPLMTFSYVLQQEGISATLVDNIDFNMMTAAFEGGTADYCTMFEPTASEYQAAGKGYILASVGQQAGEIPYTCFMAKNSYIEKNGEKIEALLRAVTKAVKYINETPASTVAALISPYFDGTDEESVKTSLESYIGIDAWVTNMAMKESSFEYLQDIIEASGELERRVSFSDVILTDAADKVYREIYSV